MPTIIHSLLARAFTGYTAPKFAALVERAHSIRTNHFGNVIARDPESVTWLFAELGVVPWAERDDERAGEPARAFITHEDCRQIGLDPALVDVFIEGADDEWAGPRPYRYDSASESPLSIWYAAGRRWAATPADQALAS